MPNFSAYTSLSAYDQILHSLHVMLCCFALLVSSIPALTAKGSPEHKFGGLIYVTISFAALALGGVMAFRESSLVLFCFDAFCAYLLLSGWRAAHSDNTPQKIDWAIPYGLLFVALIAACRALTHDMGMRSFYLLFFAINAAYLASRDLRQLASRVRFSKIKLFIPEVVLKNDQSDSWLGRHITGMVGSAIANLSVIVLTLLPLSLHWLWPVTLTVIGGMIGWRDRQKKLRIRRALATVIQPKFRPKAAASSREDWRRAA